MSVIDVPDYKSISGNDHDYERISALEDDCEGYDGDGGCEEERLRWSCHDWNGVFTIPFITLIIQYSHNQLSHSIHAS